MIRGDYPFPRRPVKDEPLNADDWQLIYNFMRFVYGPFVRGVVEQARRRQCALVCDPRVQPVPVKETP